MKAPLKFGRSWIEKVVKFKESSWSALNREQQWLIQGGGVLLALFFLLVVVYLPLGARIRKSGEEMVGIQSELLQARETIASVKGLPWELLPLLDQKEISFVIDEVTGLGKSLGIHFRSIRPAEIERTSSAYSLLPIEMQLESSYKELGIFLGSLKRLKGGLVTVEHLAIEPNGAVPSHLSCSILVKWVLAP